MMESIFAMITIMICFGICMMVFTTITSGSSSALQVKARVCLQSEADRCKAEHNFSDAIVTEEQFTIEKTVSPYETNAALTEMILLAKNADGKILAEYHELLLR